MNKKFNKVVSLILAFASLFSIFAVFTYADGDTASAGSDVKNESTGAINPPESIDLLFNRNFSEGWDYNNGFGKIGTHNAYIDYEETLDNKYNYFWRIEAGDSENSGVSTLNYEKRAVKEGGTVVKFKIKADDACDLGRIMNFTTLTKKKEIGLLYVKGNTLYAFTPGNDDNKIGELKNEWISIAMVFDWDPKDEDGKPEEKKFKCTIYLENKGTYESKIEYKGDYSEDGDKAMRSIAFGIDKAEAGVDRSGMSYCIDDLSLYQMDELSQSTNDIFDLSGVDKYGSTVDFTAPIVIDIQDGPAKSVGEIIKEALCLKVGANSALWKNQKMSLSDYFTPEIIDGNLMIPLTLLLDFIDYPVYVHSNGESYDITTGTSATFITIGRDTASVDGEIIDLSVAPGYITNDNGKRVPFIAANDISKILPGWLLCYDDMGLIIIYQDEESQDGKPLLHRDTDLEMMLDIMKRFLFDVVTEDENGKEFDEEKMSYLATGEQVYENLKNKSSAHPYIFVNQSVFDNLSNTYYALKGADTKVQQYLKTIIAKANVIYSEYAAERTVTVNKAEKTIYAGILDGKKPVSEYGVGYSPAGTLDAIEVYSGQLVDLAFAYQITKNEKYAALAYDLSLALGEWTHWGPGNASNCATATSNFAIAYDWLYSFYLRAYGEKAVDNIAAILYEKGVIHGYNASMDQKICEYPRPSGDGNVYNTLTTNVNAVCSSGMIIGALALADYVEENEEYKNKCATLIGNNMQFLSRNGLDQYAPDGSYAESALMWADSTNSLVKLIMALDSATGTTYGFKDVWGFDKTFYFACYIQDSDGKIWNYHEGGADGINGEIVGIDTRMFYYAGALYNDSTLIAIRQNQLDKGSEATIFDLLFYPGQQSDTKSELALDYKMEGIHAFVSRSDWNDGALYAGIMGGSNDVYGGQLDSGNFIYRNKGINWFMDLGSDNPDIYGYYGAYRNYHYRNNAEGQNVIIVKTAQNDLPHGQKTNANAQLTQTYSNEHGSYAIIDNTSAYGSVVRYAKRGMFVTNDRKTVVIQDEVSFDQFQELTWIAHTAADIKIDSTEKIAYLTEYDQNGQEYVLRATIVSPGDYTFKVESASTNMLDATYKDKDYEKNGKVYPYDRTEIQRLVIETKQVITVNLAVVFEMVSSVGDTDSLGYEWAYMSAWAPTAQNDSVEKVVYRNKPDVGDIIRENIRIDQLINTTNTGFTRDIDKLFKAFADIQYILKTYPEDTLGGAFMDAVQQYKTNLNKYEQYMKNVNKSVQNTNNFTHMIMGVSSVNK